MKFKLIGSCGGNFKVVDFYDYGVYVVFEKVPPCLIPSQLYLKEQ